MTAKTPQDDDEMRKHQVEDLMESESDYEEESDDDDDDDDEEDSNFIPCPNRKSGASVYPEKRQSIGAASLAALAAAYVNARNSVTLHALYSKAEIDESKNNDSDDDRDDDSDDDSKEGDDSELTPSFVKLSHKHGATSKLIARESYAIATPREKAQRLLANSIEQLSDSVDEEKVGYEEEKLKTAREPTRDIMMLDDRRGKKKKKRKSSKMPRQMADGRDVNFNITPLIVGVVAATITGLVLYSWSIRDSTTGSAAEGEFDWHHGFLGYGRQREL